MTLSFIKRSLRITWGSHVRYVRLSAIRAGHGIYQACVWLLYSMPPRSNMAAKGIHLLKKQWREGPDISPPICNRHRQIQKQKNMVFQELVKTPFLRGPRGHNPNKKLKRFRRCPFFRHPGSLIQVTFLLCCQSGPIAWRPSRFAYRLYDALVGRQYACLVN